MSRYSQQYRDEAKRANRRASIAGFLLALALVAFGAASYAAGAHGLPTPHVEFGR